MLIRRSAEEGVIRSVGDPPNGIVVLTNPRNEAPQFGIDSAWEPGEHDHFEVEILPGEGPGPSTVRVETRDVIEACETLDDAVLLYDFAWDAIGAGFNLYRRKGDVDRMLRTVEFAREVRDAISEVWS